MKNIFRFIKFGIYSCVNVLLFTGSISGQILKVSDISTLEPLENVMIIRKNPDLIKITNSKGVVDISSFANADSIIIERIGYQRKMTSYQQLVLSQFVISLYPASDSLGEILIAASRFEEEREDIPVQISSI